MDGIDALNIAIALYKDRIQEELKDAIFAEYNNLLKADADARRQKTSTDIVRMSNLRIALMKFEAAYDKLKNTTGNISAIDEMILKVKREVKLISYRKNKK